MRRKNSNTRKLVLLLILVLGISIGYAALASNLKINGTSGIKSATWNIHWDNPQVTSGSVTMTKPQIVDEARQIAEFSVTLSEPGDFYEFTIDAVNSGTIPAVLDSVETTVNGEKIEDNPLPNRVKYAVTYVDGTEIDLENDLLRLVLIGDVRQTFKVRVEYSQDINPSDLDNSNDLELTFQFKANYVQASNVSAPQPQPTNSVIRDTNRLTEGQVSVGDEITIGSGDTAQTFVVISTNANQTEILSDYNVAPYTVSTVPGIIGGYQFKNVDAYSIYTAKVPFSGSKYWEDKLGTVYPDNNVYDPTYDSEPIIDEYGDLEGPEDFSVAFAVKLYKTTLESMGATVLEARLLTKAEADSLKQGDNPLSQPLLNPKNALGSYWLQTVESTNDDYVYQFNTTIDQWNPMISYFNYEWVKAGVRPVIKINTSDIQ